ncbi:MAG: HD domain-containing phosphohydrolase [Candidatus Omnitrophota bacterium]
MISRRCETSDDRTANAKIVLFELFFDKILSNIDAPSIVTDQKGRIKHVSRRFLEFFSLRAEDISGADWVDLIIPDGKKKAVRGLLTVLKEDEKLLQFDVSVIRGKSEDARVLWTALSLSNHDVEKMYFLMGVETEKDMRKRSGEHVIDERKIKEVRTELARLLFDASEKCDPDTAKHALRSMIFAERLGREVGLGVRRMENLKTASLLHDLGKLAVNPAVLFKKGKLTTEEFEHIKKHIVWGADLLSRIYLLKDIVSIMSGHHENYDGRGYPEGISGESIPLEARILSVADIYEALTAARPYREAFSREEAVAIMEYEKGHKLDPSLTDIFLAMIRKEGGTE